MKGECFHQKIVYEEICEKERVYYPDVLLERKNPEKLFFVFWQFAKTHVERLFPKIVLTHIPGSAIVFAGRTLHRPGFADDFSYFQTFMGMKDLTRVGGVHYRPGIQSLFQPAEGHYLLIHR